MRDGGLFDLWGVIDLGTSDMAPTGSGGPSRFQLSQENISERELSRSRFRSGSRGDGARARDVRVTTGNAQIRKSHDSIIGGGGGWMTQT